MIYEGFKVFFRWLAIIVVLLSIIIVFITSFYVDTDTPAKIGLKVKVGQLYLYGGALKETNPFKMDTVVVLRVSRDHVQFEDPWEVETEKWMHENFEEGAYPVFSPSSCSVESFKNNSILLHETHKSSNRWK